MPRGGAAPGDGRRQLGKGRLSPKVQGSVVVSPLLQDAEKISQTRKRAHVKVGDVVFVVQAGIPSRILQQCRQPVVDFIRSLSVEELDEIVHRSKAQAAQPSLKEWANVRDDSDGRSAIQVPVVK